MNSTDILIPKGWKVKRFGNLVENIKENIDPTQSNLKFFIAGEHMQTENFKIISFGIIGSEYLGPAFHRKFKKSQILYGSRRTYLKKVSIPQFDGICSNTTFVLESKNELIQELLPFIMHSDRFTLYSMNKSRGSTNPYILWNDIANFEVLLPPIEIQTHISQILWLIENNLQNSIETLNLGIKFKKMLVDQLFSYDINNIKEYFSEKSLNITELPLPNNWKKKKLGSISKIRYGLGQPPKSDPQGIPMIRATNIKRGKITHNDLLYVNKNEIPLGKNPYLKSGEIIIVRSGIYAGDVALITDEWENSIAGYDLVITPSPAIDPYLLANYLLGTAVQFYISIKKIRSAQPHLNSDNISEIEIPIPPIEKQKEMKELLQKIDEMNFSIEMLIANFQYLKKNKINELIEGKNNYE